MAQQEQTNITYEEYVLPYKDKFILVNIPQERIDNIIKLTVVVTTFCPVILWTVLFVDKSEYQFLTNLRGI